MQLLVEMEALKSGREETVASQIWLFPNLLQPFYKIAQSLVQFWRLIGVRAYKTTTRPAIARIAAPKEERSFDAAPSKVAGVEEEPEALEPGPLVPAGAIGEPVAVEPEPDPAPSLEVPVEYKNPVEAAVPVALAKLEDP